MAQLPQNYDHQTREKHWQNYWLERGTYHWDETASREETYVIDTPPPTVSGLLHMGHIFSYTQADFIARFQRMAGKTVFYPMGFDDNGLPTERLVEKTKKVRATDMSREDFIKLCEGVAEEARQEFRKLFQSTALSVDWRQEYSTISEESRKISQMSFLDMFRKGEVYRKLQPMLWDPVDQTAIAQAEVEDKELPSHFNDIYFEVVGMDGNPLPASFKGRKLKEDGDAEAIVWRDGRSYIVIGTTRPELIPACVGVFFHSEDSRYAGLKGCTAITPLFGVKVPILTDDTVEPEKGTGIMMCCTFGDEKDIEKWRKHDLPTRVVLNKYGKLDFSQVGGDGEAYTALANLKVSNTDPKHPGARQKVIEMLRESGDLIESRPITHAVKCAERSGAPLEILPTYQWFVKVLDKKEPLKEKAAQCEWHPEWMKVRMDQWIDGLNWDWCISRQRYFGVPFPVWYVQQVESQSSTVETTRLGSIVEGTEYSGEMSIFVPEAAELPINPMDEGATKQFFEKRGFVYKGFDALVSSFKNNDGKAFDFIFEKDSKTYIVSPEADVMDTWATSSVSPQLSSKGISRTPSLALPLKVEGMSSWGESALPLSLQGEGRGEGQPFVLNPTRHAKLFPADLRPQAHEIIRTWAFYTVVKAHLHENMIPWKNLMISGWCLAADKTKMSKSKGNVVTPVELIEEKGTDAVRYWASTSKLGTDTAFSEDLLKIGRKLVTKLWNAAKLADTLLEGLEGTPTTAAQDAASGIITETLDKWLISKLHIAIEKATKSFEAYEYADARVAIEDWFWNDFCDNYLELSKMRAYGNDSKASQQSALYTIHHCLNGVLKLFAPIVPHITEELFSGLYPAEFAKAGSLHARGMWPRGADYKVAPDGLEAGAACVSLLNAIRKAKSEKNVSIKFPLANVVVSPAQPSAAWAELPSIAFDLKGAGNVIELVWSESPVEGTLTEDGHYTLAFTFAEQTDAA